MIFLEEFIWKKKYKHRFNLKEVAEGEIGKSLSYGL